MYRTLVDPIRSWERLEQYVPDEALRVAEVWRQNPGALEPGARRPEALQRAEAAHIREMVSY